MATAPFNPLLRFIRSIAAAVGTAELTDGQLVERFVAQRDEAAFTALLHRHGPMVLRVSREVLNDAHDAEDVFQATFLVLVRQAKSIGKRESVGSWLHGVAYRLARKARTSAARRRRRERRAATVAATEPSGEVIWSDLRPVLHEEVNRLPERYRTPFVLCYLEGKTNEEAAQLLGWPKGTVQSNLSRAREQLRQRLTRRGLTLATAGFAAVLSPSTGAAGVPPILAQSTLYAALWITSGSTAAGAVSGPVLALVEGMTKTVFLTKVKLLTAGALVIGLAGVAAGVLADRTPPAPPVELTETHPTPPIPLPVDVPRSDQELLQGEWRVVAGEQHQRPVVEVREDRLTIAGAQFVWEAWRGEVARIFRRGETAGTFQLGTVARYGQIDLVDNSLLRPRTLRGIYRLEGNRLTVCVGDPDRGERPVEFTTDPDDRRMIWLFERIR